jgi:hypothetical protein
MIFRDVLAHWYGAVVGKMLGSVETPWVGRRAVRDRPQHIHGPEIMPKNTNSC